MATQQMTRPPTNAIAAAQKQRSGTIRAALESRAGEMGALIPKHLTTEKLLRVALFAIGRDQKLLECSDRSLVECVLKAASLGLEPNTPLGHAYLVPYGREATLIIGYRGFVQLAVNSGNVSAVWARLAYQGEIDQGRFTIVAGTRGEHIEHRPVLDDRERGDFAVAYAVARMKDGSDAMFDWMTRDQVDAIRKRSKASGSGPWVTDYEEMAKKTAIRRLAKSLPLSPELHERIAEVEEGETVEGRANMVQVPAGPVMRPIDFALPASTEPAHDPRTGEVLEPGEEERAEIVAAEYAASTHPVDLLLQEVGRAADGKALDGLAERAARELGAKEPRRGEVHNAIDSRRRQIAPRNG